MVSAFAPAIGLCFGQVKTEEHSNEITAIPALLKILDIKGCLITIDAMGNQQAIAQQIVEQGGDYLLAVKGNQGMQHEEITDYFETAVKADFRGVEVDLFADIDKNHGRIEERRCAVIKDLSWMPKECVWRGMRSVVRVEGIRTKGEKTSREVRYFVSSRKLGAQEALESVRGHWGIENRLHWVLDVEFGEDGSRIRMGNAAENMSVLRRLALNVLRLDDGGGKKRSIRSKRLIASQNNDYLCKLLNLNID